MKEHSISGIPVVEGGGNGRAGKLVGILTNRDVRFATDPQPDGRRADDQGAAGHRARGRRARTRPSGSCTSTASRSCWSSTSEYRCVGLITVKDIEKAVANPNACKDEQGRLRVAAATTVGDKGYERTERLIEAGVDLVVVDTAHGHSQRVLDAVDAHQAAVQRGAGGRRQHRDRRGRQGADRRRRRRHQGRHRAGLDLHHAHRRRRRRAAAHRDHGRGRGRAQEPARR